jgi:glycosyltransferase involved in cell wall biosynthesis
VVFANRYFFPDESATSQILSDVAFDLAASGRRVGVITSRLTYENAVKLAKTETISGVGIERVSTTGFGRGNLLGRSLDYLSFYASATIRAFRTVSKGDVLVIKTDPPLLSVPLGLVARLKGAGTVNWLQDLYPEVAAELGVGFARGPVGRFLRLLRNRSIRKADMNVALGTRMNERLNGLGVDENRTTAIHNFVDDGDITPMETRSPELRRAWGLEDKDFVVGYSGNLGRAHDLQTMLGAARLLKNEAHIKFLFIGGGKLRETLAEEAARLGLENVILKPYQPRSELGTSLNLPDIHWLTLRPELEGLIVPSKLYGIAAAGRPMIFIGDETGEVGRLADTFGFGVTITPGDSARLADTLRHFSRSPERLESMGNAARAFIDTSGTRAYALYRWRELLEALDQVRA